MRTLTSSCQHLKHLRLEHLLSVNLNTEPHLPLLCDLLSARLSTLATLDLSRNQLAPSLLDSLAALLSESVETPALETLTLRSLRLNATEDPWSPLLLGFVRSVKHPMQIVVSEGQTVGKRTQGWERVKEEASRVVVRVE